MPTSATPSAVLGSPLVRKVIEAAHEHNRLMIRMSAAGHFGSIQRVQPYTLRVADFIGAGRASGIAGAETFGTAALARPYRTSVTVPGVPIGTRSFAKRIETRPQGQRFLEGVELDTNKRLAKLIRDDIGRLYGRWFERVGEQFLRQNREMLQGIARDALKVDRRTWAATHVALALAAAVAEVVPAESPPEAPSLDAMDFAMLAAWWGVVGFVAAQPEDVLDTAFAAVVMYLIFAAGLPRAALVRLLRDMQGRD